MECKVTLVILFAVFCYTNGSDSKLPSYMTPCEIGKEFESCVRKQIVLSLPHFTKGIPELGVPSIDPVSLEDIKIDGNGLQLLLTDPQLHGLSKSKLTDFKVNLDEDKFTLAFKTNISLTANYTVDGQILILPIKGRGDAIVKCRNIEVTIKSKLIYMNDSKGEHFKLGSPIYSYNIEKTTFQFQNLFNGNKQLAEATHRFANENWQQIMDDLAPPAVKQIVKNTIKVINKFFAKLPVKEVIPSYKPHQEVTKKL